MEVKTTNKQQDKINSSGILNSSGLKQCLSFVRERLPVFF